MFSVIMTVVVVFCHVLFEGGCLEGSKGSKEEEEESEYLQGARRRGTCCCSSILLSDFDLQEWKLR